MKKLFTYLGILIVLLVLVFILGPRAEAPILQPDLTFSNNPVAEVVQAIRVAELQIENIKEDNESRIILTDPESPAKTTYSLVYLHGFSASPEEGSPIHEEFATRYGMNFYAPRLFEHGLNEEDALGDFTGEGYIESCRDAIEVGFQLGDSVIVMSCSTGGTAALYLAAHNPEIHSLILLSPNVDLAHPITAVIAMPWGKQILRQIVRQVTGDDYIRPAKTEETKKYWNDKYRYESLVELKALINATMTEETFSKITQPAYTGYYYKNEEEKDHVVSVSRIEEMFAQLGTPAHKKRKQAFPDVGNHVISSKYVSKNYEHVMREVFRFGEEVLNLQVIPQEQDVAEEVVY